MQVYEATSRAIGGLLSAHALTGDPLFLSRAETLASRLLVAFDTPSGIPLSQAFVRLQLARERAEGGGTPLAQAAGVQLEFLHLGRVTSNATYTRVADRIAAHFAAAKPAALLPTALNPTSGKFENEIISMGESGGHMYDTHLKQYLLSGGRRVLSQEMYLRSMAAMRRDLVRRAKSASSDELLTYIGEVHGGTSVEKMDHLVCFVPGMLALGAWSRSVPPPLADEHLQLARELMRTCVEAYFMSPTGLAPEIVLFHADADGVPTMRIDPNAPHSQLRPETVESLFVMWRVTRDPIYRQWGVRIFESLKHFARVPDSGYASLSNVNIPTPPSAPPAASPNHRNSQSVTSDAAGE
jgi:mannosyl-oligosaccharide alpha-1,2-mannosidase